MSTLKERLEELMSEHGLETQQQLADFAKVSKGLVNQWFRGDTGLGKKPLLEIDKKSRFSARWLADGQGHKYKDVENFGDRLEPYTVPLISWVQAGSWSEAIDLLQPGQGERVYTLRKPHGHTYALRVKGDSMEPEFTDGDIIIVEPDREPENGNFIIVRQNVNEATFKQFIVDGDHCYLKPLNSRYPIMEMAEDAEICGVVVEKSKGYF